MVDRREEIQIVILIAAPSTYIVSKPGGCRRACDECAFARCRACLRVQCHVACDERQRATHAQQLSLASSLAQLGGMALRRAPSPPPIIRLSAVPLQRMPLTAMHSALTARQVIFVGRDRLALKCSTETGTHMLLRLCAAGVISSTATFGTLLTQSTLGPRHPHWTREVLAVILCQHACARCTASA